MALRDISLSGRVLVNPKSVLNLQNRGGIRHGHSRPRAATVSSLGPSEKNTGPYTREKQPQFKIW
jgi:hypothetical protein